jgi:hypothetical protein
MGPEPAGSGPPRQGRPGPVAEAGATVPGETPEAEATLAVLTQRRFETGPGEQAQCDWGRMTVSLDGQRVKLHVLVMTLGYSRRGRAGRDRGVCGRPADRINAARRPRSVVEPGLTKRLSMKALSAIHPRIIIKARCFNTSQIMVVLLVFLARSGHSVLKPDTKKIGGTGVAKPSKGYKCQ